MLYGAKIDVLGKKTEFIQIENAIRLGIWGLEKRGRISLFGLVLILYLIQKCILKANLYSGKAVHLQNKQTGWGVN